MSHCRRRPDRRGFFIAVLATYVWSLLCGMIKMGITAPAPNVVNPAAWVRANLTRPYREIQHVVGTDKCTGVVRPGDCLVQTHGNVLPAAVRINIRNSPCVCCVHARMGMAVWVWHTLQVSCRQGISIIDCRCSLSLTAFKTVTKRNIKRALIIF